MDLNKTEEEGRVICNLTSLENNTFDLGNEPIQEGNQLNLAVAKKIKEKVTTNEEVVEEAQEKVSETNEEKVEEMLGKTEEAQNENDKSQDIIAEPAEHIKEQINKAQEIIKNQIISSTEIGNTSEVIIKTLRPLCADYESDTESVDSESDSSSTSSSSYSDDSSSDSSSESDSEDSGTGKSKTINKNSKKDTQEIDLPPIEDLKISVPEDSCVEVGKILSIVDALVVVESYKESSALDIDTVLFLDKGERTLGRIFDILGPINEPVYAVRFNSAEQIQSLKIEKGLKVYYAPKTQHTNFVFMSEVLKNRGSDASWKDNVEAPPEFQDFSDDEEERIHTYGKKTGARGKNNPKGQTRPLKRSFKASQSTPFWFGNPNNVPTPPPSRGIPGAQRFPPTYPFSSYSSHRPPFSSPSPAISNPSYFPPSTSHVLSPSNFSSPSLIPNQSPLPPSSRFYMPPRFSGPPFPSFSALAHPPHNFHPGFYQQRTPPYGVQWPQPAFNVMPPPPPPPSAEQGDRQS